MTNECYYIITQKLYFQRRKLGAYIGLGYIIQPKAIYLIMYNNFETINSISFYSETCRQLSLWYNIEIAN